MDDPMLSTGGERNQLMLVYNNGIVKPKITMNCGVIRNGKSYD
jgi:hypothetical protein